MGELRALRLVHGQGEGAGVRGQRGRALMAAIEDEARDRGRTALLLDASLNAIAFYASLGWREEARAHHELAPGAWLDCAIMTKKIAG